MGLSGRTLKFHLDAGVVFNFGFLVGLVNHVLGLAPGILNLPLYLLDHAFDLQLRVVCQFARPALGASNNFVDSTLNVILVHKSASTCAYIFKGADEGAYPSRHIPFCTT